MRASGGQTNMQYLPDLDERQLPEYGEYVMLVSASTGGARWGQVVDVAPPFVILRGAYHPHDSPLRGWDRLHRITIRARSREELIRALNDCRHYQVNAKKNGDMFCRRCSRPIRKGS